MRLLPRVSQPTLDSFRKDVYRPRLALLLLILLLGGEDHRHAEGQGSAIGLHSSRVQDRGHQHQRQLDGIVSQTTVPWSRVALESVSSFFSLDRLPFLASHRVTSSRKGKEQRAGSGRRREGRAGQSTERSDVFSGPQSRPNSSPRSTNPTSAPSGTLFRIPSLIWRLLIKGDALSAIVPLHILWIVRLAAMMMEDTIVKHSPGTPSSSRLTTHGQVLIKVSTLALVAMAAFLLSATSIIRDSLLALQSERVLPDLGQVSSLLPLRLIVFLEMTATLLSLLSPLVKLNNPRLSQRLPSRVHIPSPSHAPPVVDLLPLPPGLADILSGRSSSMQSRNGQNGRVRGSRANPVRHGAIPAGPAFQAEEVGRGEERGVRWVGGLQDPLTLPPEQSSGVGDSRSGKAQRRRGMRVQVDSSWLLENIVILWGYMVGALEYLIVTLSLPTLSPTSLTPIVALLSLRSQLSALVLTWSSARRSLECLEFVRRRWTSSHSPSATRPRWRADEESEVLCPICLELIQSSESSEDADSFGTESCLLDCGHKLHAVCLVQIFLGSKQAHCPCCHDPLKATPPGGQVARVQEGREGG